MSREGEVRIPSGCAIAAVISREGRLMTGEKIIEAMKPMHDRSNGLGGGFAGYGIYPEYKDFYAFHMFFDDKTSKNNCEQFFKDHFETVVLIPHGYHVRDFILYLASYIIGVTPRHAYFNSASVFVVKSLALALYVRDFWWGRS